MPPPIVAVFRGYTASHQQRRVSNLLCEYIYLFNSDGKVRQSFVAGECFNLFPLQPETNFRNPWPVLSRPIPWLSLSSGMAWHGVVHRNVVTFFHIKKKFSILLLTTRILSTQTFLFPRENYLMKANCSRKGLIL